MKAGDLVKEKTRMKRRSEMGIVVQVDMNHYLRCGPDDPGILHPYLVCFSDDELDWMHEGFLEIIDD